MARKIWHVPAFDKDAAAQMAEDFNINPVAALIMQSRGLIDFEDIADFLGADAELESPFNIIDMEKAVIRIKAALENFERIAIYGDYDADGVTATSLLYSYLSARSADVFYYIPERDTDGYGLNNAAIDKIASMGAKLVITVDNGISAHAEAEYLYSKGLELVITDHHQAGERIPRSEAAVNPHRAENRSFFKDWSGAGIAFKLISALEGTNGEELLSEFADIAAIGTVADIVPLNGENRIIVSHGIAALNAGSNLGIEALRKVAGLDKKMLDSGSIAFGIAPRINAAGRMGAPERALKLFLAKDASEAEELALEIDAENKERQRIEQDITDQALLQIAENPDFAYNHVVVVSGRHWHGGVIGIVAARLVERFGKPCIVISSDENGNAKGSGRSIPGFSLYNALCAVSDTLLRFGGHELAAGLSLEADMVDEFREKVNAYASSTDMPFPQLNIDCRINPSGISFDVLDSLGRMEPFGEGNPRPVFGLYNMQLDSVQPIGGGKHIRLNLSKNSACISALRFGKTCSEYPFRRGDFIDLALTIEENEYLGERRISLKVKEERPAGADDKAVLSSLRLYDKIKRGDSISDEEYGAAFPDRAAMAQIYRLFKEQGGWSHDFEILALRLHNSVSICAVKIAVDAMLELGLLTAAADGIYKLSEEKIKVDLADSAVLKNLKLLKRA